MENRVDKLLQEFRRAASYRYLSDLHSASSSFGGHAKEEIANIPDEDFSLDEWNKAATYVTGTNCSFSSISEVKKHLT